MVGTEGNSGFDAMRLASEVEDWLESRETPNLRSHENFSYLSRAGSILPLRPNSQSYQSRGINLGVYARRVPEPKRRAEERGADRAFWQEKSFVSLSSAFAIFPQLIQPPQKWWLPLSQDVSVEYPVEFCPWSLTSCGNGVWSPNTIEDTQFDFNLR